MPPIERIGLVKKFVFFKRKGTDKYGNATFFPPEETNGRLEDRRPNAFSQLTETETYESLFYSSKPIPNGSLIIQGSLESVVGTGTGTGSSPVVEPYEVSFVLNIPDIKGINTFYRVGVSRFRNNYVVEY